MKIQLARRRFYNKWLYKVTVKVKAPYIFRNRSIDEIIAYGKASQDQRDLALFLNSISKDDFQIRIESPYVDIYLNSDSIVTQLCDLFDSKIKHVFNPHPDLSLNTDSKKIIANKLPYDRYGYKVFLKPFKLKDQGEKENYLQWIKSQFPRIRISPSTEEWFRNTSWNWDRRYVYIEDEKTLLLAKMKRSEVMGSVYSYQLSINS